MGLSTWNVQLQRSTLSLQKARFNHWERGAHSGTVLKGEDTPSSEEGLFLLSQWKDKSNKVLAAGLTGGLELNPANSVCSARQIWRLAGDQILNQMTGQPLRVGGVSSWTVQEHPKTPELVYIKAAGTKSKKDYLKVGKLGRKYGWRLTRI